MRDLVKQIETTNVGIAYKQLGHALHILEGLAEMPKTDLNALICGDIGDHKMKLASLFDERGRHSFYKW